MENVLTKLFQLPILPCTVAIANVRGKFLHMYATTTASELFTRMAALKFVNAVTQSLLQYRLLNHRASTFQLSRINNPKLE